MRDRILLTALLLPLAPAAPASDPPARPSPEENILRKAGVAADDDGLKALFRGRTLGDEEKKRIGDVIRRLGADDFDDRERAAKELRAIGGRATPLVRAAAGSADAEIAVRAKAFLKEVDGPAVMPAVAAARLLARRGPADAVPVLLDYVPFADDGAVEDEVLAALLALTPDGKAGPALAAAPADPLPPRRAAAAYVLGRKGDAPQREGVRKLLKDADALVRWRAAEGLLASHDRAAVPALIALLAEGPFDPAWRAEELLRRLAGDGAPAVWLDDTAAGRRKCRDAWAAWWREKGDKAALSAYTEPPRMLGYTLGVEYNTGRVWECDLDGSIRWEITGLKGPMDAQVLPDGNVLIVEFDSYPWRATERDLRGKALRDFKVDARPNGCQRLENGNTFVSTRYDASEFDPQGALLYSYNLNSSAVGLCTVRKGRGRRSYYVTGGGIGEYEPAAEVSDKPLNPIRGVLLSADRSGAHYECIQCLPGDRYLATDVKRGSLLEVDGAGMMLWQSDVPGACGAERLANGHTLVAIKEKILELDPAGREVWSKPTMGVVRRAYRR